MGWAKDRFVQELASAGIYSIGDGGLSRVEDYSEFRPLESYEYCIFIDGNFSDSYESLDNAVTCRTHLEHNFPNHDYKIVVLKVENNDWKAKHFETWIAVIKDGNAKIHIYKKYLCPTFQLDRFKAVVSLKGTILACFREEDVVERKENMHRTWVDF